MEEDAPLSLVSPSLMENQLNVLIDANGKEDTHHIIAYSPPSVIREPLLVHRHFSTLCLCSVLKRLGCDRGLLEMVVLHDQELVFPSRLRAMVHQDHIAKRWERVPAHSCLIVLDNRLDTHLNFSRHLNRVHHHDRKEIGIKKI